MSNLTNNPEAISKVFIVEGLKKEQGGRIMREFFSVVMLVLVAVICFSAVGVSATAADKSRTVRTYIMEGGVLTNSDSFAIRVGGMKIGFWGEHDKPIGKPASIQKWIDVDGITCYNALFASESDARAFIANPNRETIVKGWRTTLDSAAPAPDPRRQGASQVFMSMP